MVYRKKRNSSKVNLTISFIVHAILVGALAFFAARQGILGKKLKQLTVVMVPKEKKPEPPKEKPGEPKVEPPKPEEAPKIAVAQPKPEAPVAAPPAAGNAPAVAPAAVSLPAFEFSDGAKEVITGSGPGGVYKGMFEHALLARWNRPEDINDETFVAEVRLTVDTSGTITGYQWLSGSGNARWDKSVKEALAQIKRLNSAPPKGFPSTFDVRFDVQSLKTDVSQFGSLQ